MNMNIYTGIKMVSILILAPFKYFFNNKMRWVLGGQTLTFNLSRLEDKAHLKLLLDPNFGCRKFIQVDPKIREMVSKESYYLEESIGETVYESPTSFLTPPQLPTESPFISLYEESKKADIQISEFSATTNESSFNVEEPIVLETLPEPILSQSIDEVVDEKYNLSEQIQIRFEELDNAHYTKVKTLCEEKGLEYTNKQDNIIQILSQEFQRSIETIKDILKVIKNV